MPKGLSKMKKKLPNFKTEDEEREFWATSESLLKILFSEKIEQEFHSNIIFSAEKNV